MPRKPNSSGARGRSRSDRTGRTDRADQTNRQPPDQTEAVAKALLALSKATKQVPDAASADRTATAGKAGKAPKLPARWKKELARHAISGKVLAEFERLNRRQLLPHYATAGLVGLAAAVHDMAAQANTLGAASLATALAASVGGVAGQIMLRKSRELYEQWRTWSTLLTGTVGMWLVVAVSSGVDWTLLAAALAVEQAFGARWWRHHRHPDPVTPVRERTQPATADETSETAPPIEIEPGKIAHYADRWATYVGNSDGVLAGATLVDGVPFAHGIQYLLRLVPGKQDIGNVRQAMSKVASGLGVPETQLIVEQHDTDDDPSILAFRVVTASPVRGDIYFRGPKYHNGNITLGPYADGVGTATWRLYSPNSMWGGIVIGGTGSGKSRLVEVIALVALFTGLTYIIHVDGADGASCPTLWEHAQERYDSDEVDLALDRIEAIKKYRSKNRPRGAAGFTPSAAVPGVLVVVDEAHAVINKPNAARWSNIAREGRKLLIGLLMADQDGSLDTFIKSPLRGSLREGNGVGMHTAERAQGAILSHGQLNLFDLPAVPGFAFSLGDKARHAPFKAEWLPAESDAQERANEGNPLPTDVRLIESWYEEAPKAALDPGAQNAADEAVRRRKRPVRGQQRPPGRPPLTPPAFPTVGPPGGRTTRQHTPAPGGGTPAPAHAAAPAGSTPPAHAAAPTGSTPPAHQAAGGPSPMPAAPAMPDAVPALQDLTDTQQAVLVAIADHELTQPGAIALHLGVTRQHVQGTLVGLLEIGLVRKTGAGPSVAYNVTF